MKKSLITLLLVVGVAASALAQAPAGQAPAAGQQAAPAQQKKEIKDPAEYNAYMAAVNTQDPNQKASALESFLQTYPNSVIKEDAMELLMKTYQQIGNVQKIKETGQKLLQVNPNNLTALALLSYLDRYQALSGAANASELLAEGAKYAETGMQQLQTAGKPEGYSDADWTKMKDSFRSIFAAAIGTNALQNKNYQQAVPMLEEAVKANPKDYITVYQLAVSYLEQKPPVVAGLFWGARAVALAQQQNPQAAQQFQRYVRSKYIRYHGAEDGFPELLQAAATQENIPDNFTVAPAPSPAEQAAMMLQQKAPTKMGFGEWVFILTSGNQEAADTVWNAIKGKPLQMIGNVITSSPKVLTIAGTEDAISANTAEITLNMKAAIPAKIQPKPGEQITFEGTPSSYTPNPFMITLDDGALIVKAAPAAAKKPAAGRRLPPKK